MKRKIMFGSQLQNATAEEILEFMEAGRKILEGATFEVQKPRETTQVEKLELKVSNFFQTSRCVEASRALAKLIKAVRKEEAEKYNRERN
jgi:hypothetical protein